MSNHSAPGSRVSARSRNHHAAHREDDVQAAIPDLPTMSEQGVKMDVVGWWAAMVPTGTPKPVVDRLQTEISKVLKLPDVRDRLLRDGIEPVGNTPEEFAAFTRRERDKWCKVIRDAGVKVE